MLKLFKKVFKLKGYSDGGLVSNGNYNLPKEKKTLYDFLTEFYKAKKENEAMANYIYDHQMKNCDFVMSTVKMGFKIRHGISRNSSNQHVWEILRKYVEGELIEKK